MLGHVAGWVLIAAAVLWGAYGLLTEPRPPKGQIGSNEEFERLSRRYSAPFAVLTTAGILLLLYA